MKWKSFWEVWMFGHWSNCGCEKGEYPHKEIDALCYTPKHILWHLKDLAGPFRSLWHRLSWYRAERKRFRKHFGYDIDLKNPRSFPEKVVWKKINDRNPLLPVTADKYAVRTYLRDILGKEKAEKFLIPLLHVTDDPQSIPFHNLRKPYIIKANHSSGKYIIIDEDACIDKEKIRRECNRWLHKSHGFHDLQWAYQKIERKIIVEKLLKSEQGKIPEDYKFFVFHGRCKLVIVDFDRHGNHTRSLFTPDWKYLPVQCSFPPGPQEVEKPDNYQEMLALAEKLGGDFDFIRVDLYSLAGQTYFGELTHYPGGGHERFVPETFNMCLGEYWEIKEKYWEK